MLASYSAHTTPAAAPSPINHTGLMRPCSEAATATAHSAASAQLCTVLRVSTQPAARIRPMVSGARPDLITRRQRDCGLRAMVRPAASARVDEGPHMATVEATAPGQPATFQPIRGMNSTLGPGE